LRRVCWIALRRALCADAGFVDADRRLIPAGWLGAYPQGWRMVHDRSSLPGAANGKTPDAVGWVEG
jgi:hypothetical protein